MPEKCTDNLFNVFALHLSKFNQHHSSAQFFEKKIHAVGKHIRVWNFFALFRCIFISTLKKLRLTNKILFKMCLLTVRFNDKK